MPSPYAPYTYKDRAEGLQPKDERTLSKRAISPEVFQFLDYLKKAKVLNDFVVERAEKPDLALGLFVPGRRLLIGLTGGPEQGDPAMLHESVHALLRSNRSRAQRVASLKKRLDIKMTLRPFSGVWTNDITWPKDWVSGEMSNPLISSFGSFYGPDYKNRPLGEMSQKTSDSALHRVRQSVPKGLLWSGIPNYADKGYLPNSAREEALAYDLTSTELRNRAGQARRLGAFLLDMDVPDTLVLPLLDRLKEAPTPKHRYSGGLPELRKLLEKVVKKP